ncbi:hypothetical protein MVEN_02159000 [Mycena venus]|uniref:F-box domain-containing protein n=1 Tax=Mycena venus TaxID=2733690 RepID=A0A8H6X8F1_9AGAR|nr:hypothetical protein MVEN_02159000 [Mycena venus]
MDKTTPVSLPTELERGIFELAAWQSPETITTLILVARRVCIWIEPQLYRVVLSRDTERLQQMMRSKPPEFLRNHVHHLAICSSIPRNDITLILSTCTHVHDLAVWTGDTYPELLADIRKLTNLQHLSIDLFELFGGDDQFQLPCVDELPFAHLTHLDIFTGEPEDPPPEKLWPVFGMLPCLTHLSFTDFYIREMVQMALDTCPVLQLLVILWTDMEEEDISSETADISDPRFCIIGCPLFESDWEEGARGGLDFWCRAEIACKGRGDSDGVVSQDARETSYSVPSPE